jgi:hypothetical protein
MGAKRVADASVLIANQYLNNRAENSINRRVNGRGEYEGSSPRGVRFVEIHGIVASHFRLDAPACSPPLIIATSAEAIPGLGTQ